MARFQRGISGNLKGRPVGARSLASKIRERAGDDAGLIVDELFRLAFSGRVAARVRADIMKFLIERACGRVPSDVNITTSSSLDLRDVDLSKASDGQIEQLHEAATTTARIVHELRGEPTPVH